jgi:hypothetical protein
MVSLNNRIYFRDHRRTAEDDIVESGQIHHSAVASSSRFSQAGPPTHLTTIGDSFNLNTISHTIDLEKKGKGEAVSVSSDPKY